jgi:hypothetical protein
MCLSSLTSCDWHTRRSSMLHWFLAKTKTLSKVADEVRAISKFQMRWIKVACPHPMSPARQNRRGINGTECIHIDSDYRHYFQFPEI